MYSCDSAWCPAILFTDWSCSSTDRVRLLLSKGHSCYRPRRKGERKRKSVRGCIVDATLSVVALVLVKKGEQVRVQIGSGVVRDRWEGLIFVVNINLR